MSSYKLNSIKYALSRFLLFRKYLTAYVKEFDFFIKFRIEDAAGRRIYKRGNYEVELTEFIKSKMKFNDDDIIIDIGANLGWYSLVLDRITASNVKIYSFEPDPLNFELLSHNIKENNAEKITLINKAVSDKKDTMKLHLYPNKNRGRHSLLPINEGETVDVETISMDEFVSENNIKSDKVKFIKIDIEGYELIAFRGAKTLLTHVPFILSEFSPGYMKKGNIKPEDMIELLESYDYEPFIINNEPVLESIDKKTLLGRDSNINLFWIKKEMSVL